MKKRVSRTRVSHTRDHAAVGTMVTHLFAYGAITVTDARARQVQRLADRAISRGKTEDASDALRSVIPYVKSEKTARRVIAYSKKYGTQRTSGFVSRSKVGYRRGDGAAVSKISLIGWEKPKKEVIVKK